MTLGIQLLDLVDIDKGKPENLYRLRSLDFGFCYLQTPPPIAHAVYDDRSRSQAIANIA